MSTALRSKLNQLLNTWPAGTVFTAKELVNKGYSYKLINKYKQSKWIEQIAPGAYIRYKSQIDWTGALYAIQKQLKMHITPGGKTALSLLGFSHFINFNFPINLFGTTGMRLPKWFWNYDWNTPVEYIGTNLFPYNSKKGFTSYHKETYSITISSPERAILELLYLVPNKITFIESFYIFESFINARPNIVNDLLHICNSIKVKRLFLYMAEKHNHSWFRYIKIKNVNIGNGKRVIVKDGILDKKYLITIPKRID